ncbi:MAG: hypothetical protein JWQ19_2313 [Subtercola sp.]|nr:hypothetical protein [Subtercola sp.]
MRQENNLIIVVIIVVTTTEKGSPTVFTNAAFRKNWQPASAVIVLVTIKRVSSDGLTPTREWAADVTAADGTVTRAKIGEPRWVTDFWPPSVGAVIAVEIDTKSASVRFDMKDPQLSVKGQDKLKADAFAAALRVAPTSTAGSANAMVRS